MCIQKAIIMGLLATAMTIGSITPAQAGGQSLSRNNEGLGFALAAIGGLVYLGVTGGGGLGKHIAHGAGAFIANRGAQYVMPSPSYAPPVVYATPLYYGAPSYQHHGYHRYDR